MSDDPKRKRRYLEDGLQIGIVYALRMEFAEDDLIVVHPANGGKRGKSEAAKLKAMGVLAGTPDLLFWWPGPQRLECGFIELKIPKGLDHPAGTLNENQEIFRDRVIPMGGKWALCRSYDEVKSTLLGWGVRTKAMREIKHHS